MNGIFARVGESLRRQRDFNRTLSELNAMSDAEARDLGIHRSDFRSLAAKAVYGR